MRNRRRTDYIRIGLTAFAVIAASLVLYYIMFHAKSLRTGAKYIMKVLAPITYGVLIAYIVNPFMQSLENGVFTLLGNRKKEMRRGARMTIRIGCILAAMVVFWFLIYFLIKLMLPQLIDSVQSIVRNYPSYEASVTSWLSAHFNFSANAQEATADIFSFTDEVYNWVLDKLPDIESIASNVTQQLLGFANFIRNFILGFILSIYFLISKETIAARGKRMLYAFLPIDTTNRILHNIRFVDEKFGGFLLGKMIDSAIIGVLCYVFMRLLNMPYTMLISVIIGVTNMIPFFGPIIGAVPCAVLVFVNSPIKALYFVILIVVLQQFDGNILGPFILGNSTGLSSLMVVVSIILCNALFGLAGALFGVPLVAILVGFVQSHIRKSMDKKGLPRELIYYDRLQEIRESDRMPIRQERNEVAPSLYDRLKRHDLRYDKEGLKSFLKEEKAGDKSDPNELPEDPVDLTEEEARENKNIPLVK